MLFMLALAAATAMLQTPNSIARDLRCLVASELLIARAPTPTPTPTPTLQQEVRMMMIYFLGCVEAEVAEADLAAKLSETLKATPKGAIEKETARCASELQAAGQRLQALGAQLKARGE